MLPTALVDKARGRFGKSRLGRSWWSKLCEGSIEVLPCELTVDEGGVSCDIVELRCFLGPKLSVTFPESGVFLGISIFATASGVSPKGNWTACYATNGFYNSFRSVRTSALYLQPLCCSRVCVVNAGRHGTRAKASWMSGEKKKRNKVRDGRKGRSPTIECHSYASSNSKAAVPIVPISFDSRKRVALSTIVQCRKSTCCSANYQVCNFSVVAEG
jgi:hypothetical protein